MRQPGQPDLSAGPLPTAVGVVGMPQVSPAGVVARAGAQSAGPVGIPRSFDLIPTGRPSVAPGLAQAAIAASATAQTPAPDPLAVLAARAAMPPRDVRARRARGLAAGPTRMELPYQRPLAEQMAEFGPPAARDALERLPSATLEAAGQGIEALGGAIVDILGTPVQTPPLVPREPLALRRTPVPATPPAGAGRNIAEMERFHVGGVPEETPEPSAFNRAAERASRSRRYAEHTGQTVAGFALAPLSIPMEVLASARRDMDVLLGNRPKPEGYYPGREMVEQGKALGLGLAPGIPALIQTVRAASSPDVDEAERERLWEEFIGELPLLAVATGAGAHMLARPAMRALGPREIAAPRPPGPEAGAGTFREIGPVPPTPVAPPLGRTFDQDVSEAVANLREEKRRAGQPTVTPSEVRAIVEAERTKRTRTPSQLRAEVAREAASPSRVLEQAERERAILEGRETRGAADQPTAAARAQAGTIPESPQATVPTQEVPAHFGYAQDGPEAASWRRGYAEALAGRPKGEGDKPYHQGFGAGWTEGLRRRRAATTTPQPQIQGVAGRESKAKTRSFNVETDLRVVELDNLVSSFDRGYDASLQPRDRSRQASELQVQTIASRLDPERLGDAVEGSVGAPIVGPDGQVEGGNGRVAAMRLAARAHPERAEAYRNWLTQNSPAFGVDASKIAGMKDPVLVRVRRSTMDAATRRRWVEELNEASVAAASSSERAMVDAGRMSPQIMELFEAGEEGDLMSAGNTAFRRAFVQSVVPETERGGVMTPTGEMSQEGAARIRNALLAKGYGDAEVLRRITEDTDTNIRSVAGGLLIGAGRMASIHSGIDAGELHAHLAIRAEIAEAARKLSDLRGRGVKVRDYLDQIEMFGEDPIVKALVEVMGDPPALGGGARASYVSARRIGEFITEYAKVVEAAGHPAQQAMFDTPVTKQDAIATAIRRVRRSNDEGLSLFGSEREERGDAGPPRGPSGAEEGAAPAGGTRPRTLEEPVSGYGAESRRAREYDPKQLEFIYDDAETRPEITPEQKQVGLAAAKALFHRDRRAGGSILGSALWRDFIQHKGAELVGQTARSAHELALLAQILRDNRFETLRFFFLKDGRIVGHTGLSSRLPGMTSFLRSRALALRRSRARGLEQVAQYEREAAGSYKAQLDELRAMSARLGADGYYLMHNHPSGRATPSNNDVAFTKEMSRQLRGFKGHLVIDHGEFALISEQGAVQRFEIPKGQQKSPELPHDLLGREVVSPEHLKDIGRELEAPEGMAVLVSTTAQGRVAALAEVPVAALTASKGRAMARVRRFARMTGATNTFVIGRFDPAERSAIYQLFDAGLIRDAVNMETGVSFTERGGNLPPSREPVAGAMRVEQPGSAYGRRKEAVRDAWLYTFLRRVESRLASDPERKAVEGWTEMGARHALVGLRRERAGQPLSREQKMWLTRGREAQSRSESYVEPGPPSVAAGVRRPVHVWRRLVTTQFSAMGEVERELRRIAGLPRLRKGRDAALDKVFDAVVPTAASKAEADIWDFKREVVQPILSTPGGDAGTTRIAQIMEGPAQTLADRTLRLQVESGMMSQEVYDAIKASGDFYAPFRVLTRSNELEAQAGTGRSISTTQQLTQAIVGIRHEDFALEDFMRAFPQQMIRGRVLAEKNAAMLKLDELAEIDPQARFVRRLDAEEAPRRGYEAVSYRRAGEPARLEVHPQLARAVKGLSKGETEAMAKILYAGQQAFRVGATTANVGWQAANFAFADMLNAALISKFGIGGPVGSPGEAAAFLPRAVVDLVRFPLDAAFGLYSSFRGNVLTPNQAYLDALRSGWLNSTIQREITPEVWRTNLGLPEPMSVRRMLAAPVTIPYETMARLTNTLEETWKIATGRRGMRFMARRLASARTPDEAARIYSEIQAEVRRYGGSPDFARQGELFRAMGMAKLLFTFVNARVQGTGSGLARLGGAAGLGDAVGAHARLMVAVGLPTVYLWWMNHQDDDRARNYRGITERERYDYFNVPLDRTFVNEEGQQVADYAKAPKREMVRLYSNMIESALDYLYERDPDGAKKMMWRMFDDLSPVGLNPVASLNPVIRVPAEEVMGVEAYSGREIEPERLKRLPPEKRYDPGVTPEPYVALGEATGISPKRIEHVARGMFASIPGMLAPTRPTSGRSEFAETSVGRRFRRSPFVNYQDLYDAFRPAEQAFNYWRTLKKQGRREEAEAWRAEHAEDLLTYRRLRKLVDDLSESRRKLRAKPGEPVELSNRQWLPRIQRALDRLEEEKARMRK